MIHINDIILILTNILCILTTVNDYYLRCFDSLLIVNLTGY